ncbi:MAG: hypothetical protein M1357_00095, partial [Candidatus Marsarchaeota archaeon]|nr:hypothetical protein [Candidatus Marsarchaeota archaeon]
DWSHLDSPRQGNPPPTLLASDCFTLADTGYPCSGVSAYAGELRSADKNGKKVFVSLGETSPELLVECASLLRDAGADAFELNSLPYVQEGLQEQLVSACRLISRTLPDTPLFVKLWVKADAEPDLTRRLREAGASGFTVSPLVIGRYYSVAEKGRLEEFRALVGGRAVHPSAVEAVSQVKGSAPGALVIGCGGVYTWRDAFELMIAGADAVQVGSAVALRGEEVFGQLVAECGAWVSELGYTSLKEALDQLRHSISRASEKT